MLGCIHSCPGRHVAHGPQVGHPLAWDLPCFCWTSYVVSCHHIRIWALGYNYILKIPISILNLCFKVIIYISNKHTKYHKCLILNGQSSKTRLSVRQFLKWKKSLVEEAWECRRIKCAPLCQVADSKGLSLLGLNKSKISYCSAINFSLSPNEAFLLPIAHEHSASLGRTGKQREGPLYPLECFLQKQQFSTPFKATLSSRVVTNQVCLLSTWTGLEQTVLWCKIHIPHPMSKSYYEIRNAGYLIGIFPRSWLYGKMVFWIYLVRHNILLKLILSVSFYFLSINTTKF